ncbi:AAA family ATPase [Fervidobacterium thailandense]|uniref:Endonuclease GajA/Old nuclease/RecF-like AAA domain-containing protein n=1 Tax=Fervidobacterium thailandense TaxID=1008305 RepID=A0A1E3G2E9_9BACT|nr:AAA family ATPase [Fervidobacterium thailandense]ODN30435.1 hypothetical protein A4H02_05220 [Fervidobacterium thailandense]
MRLKGLTIKNYRQFLDVSLRFDKTSEYDFHVLVGKQGVGKTNLIDSITWLLYGREFFSRITRPDESSILNWNLLRSNTQKHTVSIRGVFEDRLEKREIIITRTATIGISSEDGKPYLYEDGLTFLGAGGNSEITKYKADAQMSIDSYFPPLVSDHFFFDGESLDTYFAATSGRKIKEVIQKLSHIEKIENIKKILQNEVSEGFTKMIKAERKREAELSNLQREFQEVRKEIEKAEEEKEILEKQIQEAKKELKNLNAQIQKYQQAEELRKRLEELKNTISMLDIERNGLLRQRLKKLINLSILVFGFKGLRCIEKEADTGIEFLRHLPKEYVQKAIEENVCPTCRRELPSFQKKLLQSILFDESFIISEEKYQQKLLEIKNLKDEIFELNKQLGMKTKQIEIEKSRLQEIRERLENQPNLDEASKIRMKIETLDYQKEMMERNLGRIEETISRLRTKRKEIENRMMEILREDQKNRKLEEKITVVSILSEIYEQLALRRREEIRKEIECSLNKLIKEMMWKKELIEFVEVTEEFDVIPRDAEGRNILYDLSGGERSLLTLAFALALHNSAGIQVPIFIDRPLTNVSGESFEYVLEVLAEMSKSRQIFITLTDKEFELSKELLFDISSTIHKMEITNNEATIQRIK